MATKIHDSVLSLGVKYVLILLLCGWLSTVLAQTRLPVIRAGSAVVDVKDGDFYERGSWNLSPDTRPDVYRASRNRKPKWVTFYTDLDSIRVRVVTGSKIDFVILLNGRDSCFTRIESSVPAVLPTFSVQQASDTIPFTLTLQDAILVKAVINQTDTLLLHFDLGTLLFRITPETLHKLKDLRLSRGGDPSAKLIRSIRMGRQIWEMPEVRVGQIAAQDMDGRFGWQAFDGRILELDYENRRLILHDRLPKKVRYYSSAEWK